MNAKHRILVMAHAHPDFQMGGGELAAYNLFKAYQQIESVEEAFFLGRQNSTGYPNGNIALRGQNDYTFEQSCIGLNLRTVNIDRIATVFSNFIDRINPSIVHFHHYVHIGIDIIFAIKQLVKNVKIVMTLHEYLGICANNGQMVKPNNHQLCLHSSPEECHSCMSGYSLEDMWLRRHSFQQLFSIVDMFVAPSEFLRQRYIEWGLAPEKIEVIENGQVDQCKLPPRLLGKGAKRNRFAFFGQITPFKGVDILLEALQALPKKQREQIVLEIHGANLEMQTAEYQERISNLRNSLEEEGILQWVGPYHPSELRKRMANIDWVVIPSIWWENSPMVIQEAFVHGRPLLVSDIGGMAEKVRDGVDGIQVQSGNRVAWGEALVKAANYRDEWTRMYSALPRPISHKECAEKHITILQQ